MNSANQNLPKTGTTITTRKYQLPKFHKEVILKICEEGMNHTKLLNVKGKEMEVVQLEFTQQDENEPINVRSWTVERKERSNFQEKTVSFTLEDKHVGKILEYLNIYQGLNESAQEYDIDLSDI